MWIYLSVQIFTRTTAMSTQENIKMIDIREATEGEAQKIEHHFTNYDSFKQELKIINQVNNIFDELIVYPKEAIINRLDIIKGNIDPRHTIKTLSFIYLEYNFANENSNFLQLE